MIKTKDQITEEISQLAKQKEYALPDVRTFSQIVFNELLKKHKLNEKERNYIIDNFSFLLEEYRNLSWTISQKLQEERYMKMYKHIVSEQIKEKNIEESKIADFLLNDREIFLYKYQLDMSLTQSYRSRTGTSFEHIIEYLFNLLNYEFETQTADVQGKPDFLFPNKKLYMSNPSECIIIGAKTKIRERYRQIVNEGNKETRHFCFTLGEDLTIDVIEGAKQLDLYFVIPSEVKISKYKMNDIFSYEEFIKNVLEPFHTESD